MSNLRERVHLLGCGAIGLLHAHAIASKFDVTLLTHHRIPQKHTPLNVRISVVRNKHTLVSNTCQLESTSSSRKQIINRLIIATKSHQTIPALNRLLPSLQNGQRKDNPLIILLLQNGVLGVRDRVIHWLKHNSLIQNSLVLCASSTHGAYKNLGITQDTFVNYQSAYEEGFDFEVVHLGTGETQFGFLEFNKEDRCLLSSPDLQNHYSTISETMIYEELRNQKEILSDQIAVKFCQNLESSILQLNPKFVTDPGEMREIIVRKLIINCVVNTIASILECNNGTFLNLVSEKKNQEFISGLISELLEIFQLSVDLNFVMNEVKDVCEKTALNFNSLLVDLKKGKDTEIEDLIGYSVHVAKLNGKNCPRLESIHAILRMKLKL